MNAISRPQTLCPASQPDPGGPIFDARMLVGQNATARIVLDDQIYVLRITRAGKLILTK